MIAVDQDVVGSGSVEIKDWKKYPMLGQPIDDDPKRSGSLFEASWTHALHCVSPPNRLSFGSSANIFSALLPCRHVPPNRGPWI